jgi:hypothetical protein
LEGGVKLKVTDEPETETTARLVGTGGPLLNDFDMADVKLPNVVNIGAPIYLCIVLLYII